MSRRWVIPITMGIVVGSVATKSIDGFVTLGHLFPKVQLVLVIACTAAAVSIQRWGDARRERKSRPNTCITCGYDLRASESRCPECGTFVRLPLEGRPH